MLLAWYRLRLALPHPLGGYGLLGRRLEAWGDCEGAPRDDDRSEQEASRLAELFRRAAARQAFAAGCAPRSLALTRLLRLQGLPARMRVGLRRAGDGLAGHAWVEHDGRVVGDDLVFVRRFTPLGSRRRSRGGSGA
jgi:hypothetical protein